MRPAVLTILLCFLWQSTFAVTVNDDLGNPVRLAAPAQRIVTLAPHATELAIAAGLKDRLVAISLGGEPPDGVHELPRIGGAGALDRERLLSLNPDLVIAWESGNRPQDLAWLTRNGIAVYRSEPDNLEQIADSIIQLGQLGDSAPSATKRANAFKQALETECAELPRQAVYVVIWERPAMTVGGRHWLNDVLHRAGYRNHFANQPRGVFAITEEARLAVANVPQLSLVRRYDDSTADRLANQLSIPGPQLADAVQSLCRQRLKVPID